MLFIDWIIYWQLKWPFSYAKVFTVYICTRYEFVLISMYMIFMCTKSNFNKRVTYFDFFSDVYFDYYLPVCVYVNKYLFWFSYKQNLILTKEKLLITTIFYIPILFLKFSKANSKTKMELRNLETYCEIKLCTYFRIKNWQKKFFMTKKLKFQ